MSGYIGKLKRDNRKQEDVILAQDEHILALDAVLDNMRSTERMLGCISMITTAILAYTLLFGWNC